MTDKFKNSVIDGLPYVALFMASAICYYFIPELNFLSHSNTTGSLISDLHRPGDMLVYSQKFLDTLNLRTVSIVIAGLLTLTAWFISDSIRLLSAKGEKTIPFFVAIILFWISAGHTFPVTFIPGLFGQLVLISIFSCKAKSVRFLPVLVFPLWYFVTGGFSIILIAMLILRIVADRQPDRLLLFLLIVILLISIFLSRYFFQGVQSLFYPLELPEEPFRRMLFLLVTMVLVFLPVLARIDFQLTSFISIKYVTSSLLISAIVASIIFLISLHETGFFII